MSDLEARAIDIETTGFDYDAKISVIGVAAPIGNWIVVNTEGRTVNEPDLLKAVTKRSSQTVHLDFVDTEAGLLHSIGEWVTDHIDGSKHYLTAFNGETWNGGFDLPMLRRKCIQHDVDWPFLNIPYADTMTMLDPIDTCGRSDLEGTYDILVGTDNCDPFDSSEEAIEAFDKGQWVDLCLHNLADIRRTLTLARIAERYVAKNDFRMKNLTPPAQ